MGNANGREEDGDNGGRSEIDSDGRDGHVNDPMMNNNNNTPPHSPGRTRSPLVFAPQVPVLPLQRGDGSRIPLLNHTLLSESHTVVDNSSEQRIPTMITWSYGGNEVVVEGSWDNWSSRKMLQRSGKDHSLLLVLASGVYHFKFIVDGEWRYIPDLPSVADEEGGICNLLDVRDYVPENLDSVAEFESPPSPNSSYSHLYPSDEDFAKEPVPVPPQLNMTLLGAQKADSEAASSSSSKPQHVMLNHLYIEKGWVAPQSVVALGLTHRFQSKYVTVVLYKPLKK